MSAQRLLLSPMTLVTSLFLLLSYCHCDLTSSADLTDDNLMSAALQGEMELGDGGDLDDAEDEMKRLSTNTGGDSRWHRINGTAYI